MCVYVCVCTCVLLGAGQADKAATEFKIRGRITSEKHDTELLRSSTHSASVMTK